jgi:hypothetical protein
VARLAHLDRATREPIRRYEHPAPGDLVHVDVKKLGNIPDGGGWRTQGITVVRVLSDNGSCYTSGLWSRTCAELGVTVKKTRPYRRMGLRQALPGFLHTYNHCHHSAIGGPPADRVSGLRSTCQVGRAFNGILQTRCWRRPRVNRQTRKAYHQTPRRYVSWVVPETAMRLAAGRMRW